MSMIFSNGAKIVILSKNTKYLSSYLIDVFYKKNEFSNFSEIILSLDAFLHNSGRQYSQSQTQYDMLCQQIEDMSKTEFMQLFAEAGKDGSATS